MTAATRAPWEKGWLLRVWVLAVLTVAVQGSVLPGHAGQNPVGALGDSGVGAGEGDEVQRLFRQAVSLGVSDAELGRLVQGCRAAGFTGAEIQRVLRLVTGAKLGGLPHFDLLDKLREGLAKGASPDAIEAALGKKAQSLRKAKGLVDSLIMEGWSAPDYAMAVQMVSDALEAGASPGEVLCAVRQGTPCGKGVADVRQAFRFAGGPK